MRAVVCSLLITFFLGFIPLLSPVSAQFGAGSGVSNSGAAAALADDIDEFFSRGAQGFIVWQYGGDFNGRKIAVDQFSFYRDKDQDICNVMQSKAQANPDKFIGVNINNIGAQEFAESGVAVEHMTWLKANCGVKVIRIFAKVEGLQGVLNALAAAKVADVQIIVAIGDYSNGGGGMPQGANKS